MESHEEINEILNKLGMTGNEPYVTITYRDMLNKVFKGLHGDGRRLSDRYVIEKKMDLDALLDNMNEEICENVDLSHALEGFLNACWEV